MINKRNAIVSIVLVSLYVYECAIGMHFYGNPIILNLFTIRQIIIGSLLILNWRCIHAVVVSNKNNPALQLFCIYYLFTLVTTIIMSDNVTTSTIQELITIVIRMYIMLSIVQYYPTIYVRRMYAIIAIIYIVSGYIYVQRFMPVLMRMANIELIGVPHQRAGHAMLYANIILMYYATETRRRVYIAVIIIITFMIMLSGARTALIANIAVLIIGLKKYRSYFVIGIVALVMYGITYVAYDWTAERWGFLYESYSEGNIRSANEVDFRANYMSIAWRKFIESPILGIGPGNWDSRIMNTYQDGVVVLYAPHNALDMLVHQGIVGVVLFYSMLTSILMKSNAEHKDMSIIGRYTVIGALIMTIGGSTLTTWEVQMMYPIGIYYVGKCNMRNVQCTA